MPYLVSESVHITFLTEDCALFCDISHVTGISNFSNLLEVILTEPQIMLESIHCSRSFKIHVCVGFHHKVIIPKE